MKPPELPYCSPMPLTLLVSSIIGRASSGDVGAAFHYLWLDYLYSANATNLSRVRVYSVPTAIPWHPKFSAAISSALGFPQDEATVIVDIHN